MGYAIVKIGTLLSGVIASVLIWFGFHVYNSGKLKDPEKSSCILFLSGVGVLLLGFLGSLLLAYHVDPSFLLQIMIK